MPFSSVNVRFLAEKRSENACANGFRARTGLQTPFSSVKLRFLVQKSSENACANG